MNDTRQFWLGFHLVSGIGPTRLRRLLEHFGGEIERAWRAPVGELQRAGLEPRLVDRLTIARAELDLPRLLERVAACGARLITWDDPEYPASLLAIDWPPPVLFVRGGFAPDDARSVAIVGTRRPSGYGRDVAAQLAQGLAERGLTIVSGLARGIDAVVHRSALAAGGRTVAVLGCGIDTVYPPEHDALAESIVAAGAVISDYAPGVPPDAANFPPRNRIISGLSLGVVVVEAAEESGALITTRFANDQGREVFAVPGQIQAKNSRGPHRLIQQGAKLILDVDDILTELRFETAAATALQPMLFLDPVEARVLEALGSGPLHPDELMHQLDLTPSQMSAQLTLLELRGLVRLEGGRVSAVP
ncbi:MAG TPA: DNA-processing protein DprA [Anaerolineales bacterium]|nr:DNA-processing protein DprA [Anaerolineales bacterium]